MLKKGLEGMDVEEMQSGGHMTRLPLGEGHRKQGLRPSGKLVDPGFVVF